LDLVTHLGISTGSPSGSVVLQLHNGVLKLRTSETRSFHDSAETHRSFLQLDVYGSYNTDVVLCQYYGKETAEPCVLMAMTCGLAPPSSCSLSYFILVLMPWSVLSLEAADWVVFILVWFLIH
jgi:hypothetical protein